MVKRHMTTLALRLLFCVMVFWCWFALRIGRTCKRFGRAVPAGLASATSQKSPLPKTIIKSTFLCKALFLSGRLKSAIGGF